MLTASFSRDRQLVGRAGGPPFPMDGVQPSVDLRVKVHDAAALLKALANPDRLLLLCRMVDVERSVGELGALTGIGQPSLSQQLGVLRGERLVATRREGKHVLYRVVSPAALAVLQTLCGLFCEPMPHAPGAERRSVATSKRVRKGGAA